MEILGDKMKKAAYTLGRLAAIHRRPIDPQPRKESEWEKEFKKGYESALKEKPKA